MKYDCSAFRILWILIRVWYDYHGDYVCFVTCKLECNHAMKTYSHKKGYWNHLWNMKKIIHNMNDCKHNIHIITLKMYNHQRFVWPTFCKLCFHELCCSTISIYIFMINIPSLIHNVHLYFMINKVLLIHNFHLCSWSSHTKTSFDPLFALCLHDHQSFNKTLVIQNSTFIFIIIKTLLIQSFNISQSSCNLCLCIAHVSFVEYKLTSLFNNVQEHKNAHSKMERKRSKI